GNGAVFLLNFVDKEEKRNHISLIEILAAKRVNQRSVFRNLVVGNIEDRLQCPCVNVELVERSRRSAEVRDLPTYFGVPYRHLLATLYNGFDALLACAMYHGFTSQSEGTTRHHN
ncbi:MAG TPA: hypothetical protein VFM10_13205, partial [Terriglobales bacterium]|nr:hypothetical protein [Terriglobales bacterium]